MTIVYLSRDVIYFCHHLPSLSAGRIRCIDSPRRGQLFLHKSARWIRYNRQLRVTILCRTINLKKFQSDNCRGSRIVAPNRTVKSRGTFKLARVRLRVDFTEVIYFRLLIGKYPQRSRIGTKLKRSGRI